jgi:hypothetical protein
MKKTIVFAMLIVIMTAASPVSAQTIVKGNIVNERGERVEYVSIGIEGDSIGTISDSIGNFIINIPVTCKSNLVFTHVSHEKTTIPYETYAKGQNLKVTLKEKEYELTEVVIGKDNLPKKIAGRNIPGPTVSLRGKGKLDALEWGPVFKSKKDYVISDILLTVKGCSYQWCVLSFNIYEIQDDEFVNILNKPIYQRIEKSEDKQRIDIRPDETIILKKKKKYYISVAIVDSDNYGILDMQSQFKKSYARNIAKGKIRKLPIGPAIVVKGHEIEQQP